MGVNITILSQNGVRCLRDTTGRKKPRNRYVNRKDRPDIIDYDTGVGANVKLDFSLARPFSKDIVTGASEKERFVATKKKARRYKNTPIKSTPVYTVLHSSLWYSNTLSLLGCESRDLPEPVGKKSER